MEPMPEIGNLIQQSLKQYSWLMSSLLLLTIAGTLMYWRISSRKPGSNFMFFRFKNK